MSTICLAAHRSHTTGEAVYFAWRLPGIKKMLMQATLWLLGICTLIIAGLYAHIYWNCRHPVVEHKPVKIENPDTRVSEMHYVYVSKPFPEPKPKPETQTPMPPLPVSDDALPPLPGDQMQQSDESDWREAPEGSLSDRATPPDAAEESSSALKAQLMQALEEQQKDYRQGKVPSPPVDETQTPDAPSQVTPSAENAEQQATHHGGFFTHTVVNNRQPPDK